MPVIINGTTGISGVDGSAGTPAFQGSDANTGIRFGTDIVSLVTGGSDRLYIDSSGRLGVGTTSPGYLLTVSGRISYNGAIGEGADTTLSSLSTTLILGDSATWQNFTVKTNGNERLRITSGGLVGIGTTSPGDLLTLNSTAGYPLASFYDSGVFRGQVGYTFDYGYFHLTSASVLAFRANGSERMRITSGGVILGGNSSVNPSHTSAHLFRSTASTDGAGAFIIENSNSTNGTSIFVGVGAAGVGYNASNCVLGVYRCSSNSRSINAAGSINASGADYAEYMTKAGNFVIAKGDICGVNVNGKLTNKYADSIGFLVKSTDPSYVGGDVWGLGFEGNPDGLEAARQLVDRIAFAGQVPVNVIGAAPGQYIVPIESADGYITGIAKNEADMTLAEYMRAVGKVIAIEDDGRARIIVKVA